MPLVLAHATNKPVDCKIVLLGRHSVGKTSLSERYLHGEFNVKSTATIGAAFRCAACRVVFSVARASVRVCVLRVCASQTQRRVERRVFCRGAVRSASHMVVNGEDVTLGIW